MMTTRDRETEDLLKQFYMKGGKNDPVNSTQTPQNASGANPRAQQKLTLKNNFRRFDTTKTPLHTIPYQKAPKLKSSTSFSNLKFGRLAEINIMDSSHPKHNNSSSPRKLDSKEATRRSGHGSPRNRNDSKISMHLNFDFQKMADDSIIQDTCRYSAIHQDYSTLQTERIETLGLETDSKIGKVFLKGLGAEGHNQILETVTNHTCDTLNEILASEKLKNDQNLLELVKFETSKIPDISAMESRRIAIARKNLSKSPRNSQSRSSNFSNSPKNSKNPKIEKPLISLKIESNPQPGSQKQPRDIKIQEYIYDPTQISIFDRNKRYLENFLEYRNKEAKRVYMELLASGMDEELMETVFKSILSNEDTSMEMIKAFYGSRETDHNQERFKRAERTRRKDMKKKIEKVKNFKNPFEKSGKAVTEAKKAKEEFETGSQAFLGQLKTLVAQVRDKQIKDFHRISDMKRLKPETVKKFKEKLKQKRRLERKNRGYELEMLIERSQEGGTTTGGEGSGGSVVISGRGIRSALDGIVQGLGVGGGVEGSGGGGHFDGFSEGLGTIRGEGSSVRVPNGVEGSEYRVRVNGSELPAEKSNKSKNDKFGGVGSSGKLPYIKPTIKTSKKGSLPRRSHSKPKSIKMKKTPFLKNSLEIPGLQTTKGSTQTPRDRSLGHRTLPTPRTQQPTPRSAIIDFLAAIEQKTHPTKPRKLKLSALAKNILIARNFMNYKKKYRSKVSERLQSRTKEAQVRKEKIFEESKEAMVQRFQEREERLRKKTENMLFVRKMRKEIITGFMFVFAFRFLENLRRFVAYRRTFLSKGVIKKEVRMIHRWFNVRRDFKNKRAAFNLQ